MLKKLLTAFALCGILCVGCDTAEPELAPEQVGDPAFDGDAAGPPEDQGEEGVAGGEGAAGEGEGGDDDAGDPAE